MSTPIDNFLSRNPLRMARNSLLKRVVAPSSEPVSLSEAKAYMRIDASSEDSLINDLIVAARMTAESWLGRSLMTQSWKIAFDDGIDGAVFLPMGPVSAITSVVAFNQDGSSLTLASGSYWLNAAQNTLIQDASLSGFRIEITYTAGYGDASAVPRPIKTGMLAHIASLYDNRGDTDLTALPPQVASLYSPFREIRL